MLVEKNGNLYPVEFKMTKTPTMRMGDPILRFIKLFSKLPVKPGRIVSLVQETTKMAEHLSIEPLDDFLKWLRSES